MCFGWKLFKFSFVLRFSLNKTAIERMTLNVSFAFWFSSKIVFVWYHAETQNISTVHSSKSPWFCQQSVCVNTADWETMSNWTRHHLQDKRPRTSAGWTDQLKIRILFRIQKKIKTIRNKNWDQNFKRFGNYAVSTLVMKMHGEP